MSFSDSTANGNGAGVSAAQRLANMHLESHKPTIEDVPDEDELKNGAQSHIAGILESADESSASPRWVPPMSTAAAGKQKAESPDPKLALDTQSAEVFPGLGKSSGPAVNAAPIWAVKKPGQHTPNGGSNGISTNGSSTPTSGADTPPSAVQRGVPQSLAGQIQAPILVLSKDDVLSRNELKKPLPDILKNINKKLATNLTYKIGAGGKYEFRETSKKSENVKNQAIRELGMQIGKKTTSQLQIPRSSQGHIIGKGGSTIKAMQESTGARIQLPKNDDASPRPSVDGDDDMINIILEGNPIAISLAKKAIEKIAHERTASVNSRIKTIPAEFYPFIAGPNNSRVSALEEKHGVRVRVPPHHIWTSQRPPQKPLDGEAPIFLPAAGNNHITLDGDRAGVQAAREEIIQIAAQLEKQLQLDEVSIPRGQHRFIIGDSGIPPEDFFEQTGCGIIIPDDDQEDMITIVGPPSHIQAAIDFAIEQASVNSASVDISQQYRNAPGGPRIHARNVTQYLQDRDALSTIRESYHLKYVETPINDEGAQPWMLYFDKDNNANAIKARNDIFSIANAYPPSRMTTLAVDEFFHAHLRKHMRGPIQDEHRVRLIVPEPSRASEPVLLVFEGEVGPEFKVSRNAPSPQQVQTFKQGLVDARKHILDIIANQGEIITKSIRVDPIYHDKLREFILAEQKKRPAGQIAIRVNNRSDEVIFRGPAAPLETLFAKATKFLEEAVADEKERDFTLSFDFPQKYANMLIGKGGSHIRDLRKQFDVEINVNDGKVELKGPPKKAQAAKAHISALGKQWADETTHILKIDPKYHAELIGVKGAVINRLQDRYNVQIHYPRSAKHHDEHSSSDAASESGRRAPRREQAPDEVIVKGPKKGADGARDEILDLLRWAVDNSHVAIVSIQAGQIPSLIGQGGKGMDELRSTTKARIDIPNVGKEVDPSTKIDISIKGTKTQVADAKKLIESKRNIFDNTVTKTIEIEKKYHGALIGSGGSALRDIVVGAGGSDDRRELARTVQFPKAEQDQNIIKVEGNIAVVDKIIARMLEIVAERESQVTETIDVPTDKHRSLIGRGGEIKKGLEAQFKVSIDVPRQGSGDAFIKISGLPADVEKAKTHILELVKDEEGVTVQIPRKLHHTIADNGQFFRRMKADHQVRIDHGNHKVPPKPAAPTIASSDKALPLITDEAIEEAVSFNTVNIADSSIEGEIPWILRGPAENVEKVKNLLFTAQEQALKNTTIGYLSLPNPHTYRYVIGQGGSKVNSIRKATGCKITVPRDQANNDPIEIFGTAEGVEKAKDLILQAVEEGSSNSNGGYGGGRGANGHTSNGNGNWD